MLVRCNAKCKNKDCSNRGGMTNGLYDPELDEAVCEDYNEILTEVNDYGKVAMKNLRDIIKRDKKKAFQFKCEHCGDKVSVVVDKEGKPVGTTCDNKENCKFNITKIMIDTIKTVQEK